MRRLALLLWLCVASPAWAAITQASLTSGTDAVDNTIFTTASITPTANNLVIAVINNRATDPNADDPSLSGNGMTWVEITNVLWSATNRRLTMLRAMGASPSAGAVTITFNNTQTDCHWSIFEFAGVDTSGTNGSGAVVQSATNTDNPITSLTVTLAAFGSATNGAASGFVHNAAEASTPDTDWTEIHDLNGTAVGLETQWRATSDTTAAASWATSSRGAGIAIEIKEEVAGAARRVFLVQ